MENIGDTVKRLREAQGWSQSELARRVGGRIKPQNIQQLEDGTVNQPRYLSGLARAFGINIDQLLAGGKPARTGKEEGLQERFIKITQEIALQSPDKAKALRMIADLPLEKIQAILALFADQCPNQCHQPIQEQQPQKRKIKLTLDEASQARGKPEINDRRSLKDRRQNVERVDFEQRSGKDRRSAAAIIIHRTGKLKPKPLATRKEDQKKDDKG